MQQSEVTAADVNPQPLTSIDDEITAQRNIAEILIPLDKDARERVMRWAMNYFWPNNWQRGGF